MSTDIRVLCSGKEEVASTEDSHIAGRNRGRKMILTTVNKNHFLKDHAESNWTQVHMAVLHLGTVTVLISNAVSSSI